MRASKPTTYVLPLLLLLFGVAAPAWADQSDDGLNAVDLVANEQPVVTTSRSPRPISKIAENVTVINADDITKLNAHTIAEVLQTVSGFQLDMVQTPGKFSFFSILGSGTRHILVEIDGVPQNILAADLIPSLNAIPVQMVERVEIVKGAASAAWGSALGGVINIITKSLDPDKHVGGMASASIGERLTTDLRAELTGTANKFGYYLTGGHLHSNGLTPGTDVNLSHGFGKFTYDLPNQGRLTYGLDVRGSNYGLEDYAPYDYHDRGGVGNTSTYLTLSYPLTDRLAFETKGYLGRRVMSTKWGALSVPDLFMDAKLTENFRGGDLHFIWGNQEQNLTVGMEYESTSIRQRDPINPGEISNFNLDLERWSGYLNGVYSIGRLSILPGIRADHYNLFGDALSYTLGATLQVTDTTLLRAYGARGYSLPNVNNLFISNGVRQLQNIWTVQAGFETTAIPYLWLKGSLFYNDTWKIQQWDDSVNPGTAILVERASRGLEVEAKTTQYHGFALSGGYNYTYTWDKATGTSLTGDIINAPQQGAKLALNYANIDLGLTGVITGNYVWWNLPSTPNVTYKTPTWDLHLTQKIAPNNELSPELFFSVRNLFNGSQNSSTIYPNAPRWIEGGVRFKF